MSDADIKAWQEKQDRINAWVETVDETEALDFLHALRSKFGWAGTMFTDEDIRVRWQDIHEDDDNYTPLTDEQVDEVMMTYYWSRGLQDSLTENGWVVVDMAIEEIMG